MEREGMDAVYLETGEPDFELSPLAVEEIHRRSEPCASMVNMLSYAWNEWEC